MILKFLGAAAVAMGLAAPVNAAVAEYHGSFDEGYIKGHFVGLDLEGNGVVTKLLDFHIAFDDMNYGSHSYFYIESSTATDFKFIDHGDWSGSLNGTAFISYWVPLCDSWNTPPCMPGDMPGYDYFDQWRFETTSVEFVRYDLTPAPVPVPGTLPLIAGGIGALAVLRRRRKAVV
ncbi:MAG: VPLPA-CTERM sorting domain-containing protein [Paracoccus sp. (in: a-proteobacteria)]|uniref:VPLPA-CTERM sorting domain-containing protein n=1 Tax=Paracoccus sp. TaxID=267 RepID=UPI0026DF30C5|nr:VPLPA-CTERM sorting domain-containing protein [Paracoccus sp. (in: a-proteobacteria)]MDO5613503.1 VPLPA-CTERM sorting domain-containing protein [Paracoccus sp. (in: a-proteobacteria)]